MNKIIKAMVATTLLIFGLSTSANAITVAEYTDLGVPTDVDTSFKTWMDWRSVTNKRSAQYKCINEHGWVDENGFMRATGDSEFGIDQDYYLIALGSYYGTTMGAKYRITTSTGNVFYGMLADAKADIHTNSTNQYALNNNDVVEFLIDRRYLRSDVKRMGSASVYEPLKGSIAKIERIDFVDKPEPETNTIRPRLTIPPNWYADICDSTILKSINDQPKHMPLPSERIHMISNLNRLKAFADAGSFYFVM